jgi:hypothetical protein
MGRHRPRSDAGFLVNASAFFESLPHRERRKTEQRQATGVDGREAQDG